MATLTGLLFDNGEKATSLDGVSDQLYLRTSSDQSFDKLTRYGVLLVLSTAIATGGILTDSTATVIGAMIVAPLGTPIQAIGLAIVTTRPAQIVRSAIILFGSIAAVILLPLIFTAFLHLPVNVAGNGQITGRVSPGLLDLFVAIATGLVGAYATARSDLSGVLPGVAIAISLVPPLAVVGICLSQGAWFEAWGAFLLFAANAVAMIICAIAVFSIAGYGKAARHDRSVVKRPLLIVNGALLLLVVILGVASSQSLVQIIETQRSTVMAKEWLEGSSYTFVKAQSQAGVVTIDILGSGPLPEAAGFDQAEIGVLWSNPTVKVRIINGSERILDPGD